MTIDLSAYGLNVGGTEAVRMQVQRLGVDSSVQTIRNSFVKQTEPVRDAVGMKEVVKVFSMALNVGNPAELFFSQDAFVLEF